MSSVRLYPDFVQRVMPVLVRRRVFLEISDWDWTLTSECLFVEVQFVLFRRSIFRLCEVLCSLVERPVSYKLIRLYLRMAILTVHHPIPIPHSLDLSTHPSLLDLVDSIP